MTLRRYFGDRSFYRKLLTVALPILIQIVITNFVSLLDNIMVGRIGTEQMSGVAIVNQLLYIFRLCIFGAVSGAGIFTAQFHGKNDTGGVRDTFRAKICISAAATVVFIAIFVSFGDRLISLFLHDGNEGLDLAATLGYGREYMRIMLIELIPFAVSQVYASTLRETGETVLPMASGIAAVVINVVFNYILIFGKLGAPVLGVEGAAIATLIARGAECLLVVCWTHLHREKNAFISGAYSSLRIPAPLIKQIAVKGTPLLMNELLWACAIAALNQCYSTRGLEVVSAANIASTVSNLFNCAYFAMGSSISIIIGQLLGANELERAVEEDRQLITASVIICLAVGSVMALCARLIPQIYNTSDGVRSLASEMLLILALLMPVNGFVHASYFTLRTGGKTVITFLFDSGFIWSVSCTTAFVLSRLTAIPIIPMYACVQGLDIIKAVVGFILVRRRSWVVNLVSDN